MTASVVDLTIQRNLETHLRQASGWNVIPHFMRYYNLIKTITR